MGRAVLSIPCPDVEIPPAAATSGTEVNSVVANYLFSLTDDKRSNNPPTGLITAGEIVVMKRTPFASI